jgi:hypothetical protein
LQNFRKIRNNLIYIEITTTMRVLFSQDLIIMDCRLGWFWAAEQPDLVNHPSYRRPICWKWMSNGTLSILPEKG